jgi:putative serine protease PepD
MDNDASRTPPPSTTWWMPQPPPTATAPTAPPTPPSAPPRPASRGRAALLGVAAVSLASALVGGAAGATLVHDGPPTAAGPITISGASAQAASLPTGSVEQAASTIGASVVTVEVTGPPTSQGFGGGTAASDTGSGVVLRSDGYIVTNNHVVSAAAGGGSVSVTLSNGKTYPASIVGTDATSDLAVLKVTGVSGLTAATFADSDQVRVGQSVLAVGAPLGLSNTVTEGIVSTLHRPVRTGEAGASAQSVIDALQTDAAVNPGNSGGALVDLSGRVVGIPSAIATVGSSSGQSGSIGVGFAIPSNDAVKVAGQLIATGHATHPQLGISVGDAAGATTGAPGAGALVRQVSDGGPAAAAGLRAGDVITKVGDRVVTDADSLIVAVRSNDPGAVVPVVSTRDGASRTVAVTLRSSA